MTARLLAGQREGTRKELETMDNKTLVGCTFALWHILVVLSMWLALLFGILHTINAAMWLWCLYWCYVPAVVLGAIMAAVVQLAGDE